MHQRKGFVSNTDLSSLNEGWCYGYAGTDVGNVRHLECRLEEANLLVFTDYLLDHEFSQSQIR